MQDQFNIIPRELRVYNRDWVYYAFSKSDFERPHKHYHDHYWYEYFMGFYSPLCL